MTFLDLAGNGGAMLAGLLVAHFLCDYPLQGPFLSAAKSRRNPVPGFPWYQAMTAHSAIHAGAVWLLTGLWWLGVAEFVLHFIIDDAKISGFFGEGERAANYDQAAHVFCKWVWVVLAIVWGME